MKKIIYGLMALSPVLAFAQQAGTNASLSGLSNLVGQIGGIIGQLMPILFILAIVYFFWGLVKFIMGAGDAKKVAEGKGIMIYGIIALAVMASVYGLIGWLQASLGVSGGGSISLPVLPPITR